jgi:N-acetylglucosaminyl-diphospho-decaprenol L-rhamnosyltransferase
MTDARRHVERRRPAYAVVTVAYRSRPLLQAMLQRIAPPTPIIVVDNSAEHEDITDLVRTRPMTTYIDAGGNVGFGAACNLAASVASQPFIAFVNPDADVDVAVLDRLVDEIVSDERRSSAGPLLVEADGSTRSGSGGWLPTPLRAVIHATGLFRVLPDRGIWIGRQTNDVLDVEWIAGTCLVILTDVFRQLGGFASRYFLYQEDMDLGRRLRDRGYRQIVVGDLRVRHIAGTSSAVPDVRRLAWSRASALVDYLAATHGWVTTRLMCAILGLGALMRAGYEVLRGRTLRLSEFGTQALAFTFPGRTLKLVYAQRDRRRASRPETA